MDLRREFSKILGFLMSDDFPFGSQMRCVILEGHLGTMKPQSDTLLVKGLETPCELNVFLTIDIAVSHLPLTHTHGIMKHNDFI